MAREAEGLRELTGPHTRHCEAGFMRNHGEAETTVDTGRGTRACSGPCSWEGGAGPGRQNV